ncbi:MAG: ABC transporter substrate-binding protein [Spirochaetales bacterium]|jgi:branched-chain amino acid transport system substrate-binding protein
MKKLVGVLVLLLVAASLSFGQAKVVVNEWQVPFLNSLTGAIAAIGEFLQWGAEYAAAEINAAGGIAGKPVKVIGVDTALDPQKGSVEMARLVKDSLVAMGPVPEPVIMAAMPIAVENGMVSITATTSYEYAEKFFPWTVSWFPPTLDRLPPLVVAWAKQFKDISQVVQFIEPYGPWPGMAGAHSSALKSLGIKELTKVDVPTDAVTFGPLAVKAMAQKPDGVILVCNAEKAAKIIKELKNLGWTKMNHILVFSSADDAQLYATGGSDINGVQVYNYLNLETSNPRWDKFKAAFAKAHNGNMPFSLSPNYYDALYMIKEAIEKTGVTGDPKLLKVERKKIADYIANVKGFKGLLFDWDMKDGIPTNKPTYIFEIKNGKKVLVQEVRP